jgi:hypothetical protein
MKTIYIVRHCQAAGQEAVAPLTADGLAQADRLADLLADRRIERIVSSHTSEQKIPSLRLPSVSNFQLNLTSDLSIVCCALLQ